MGVTGFSDETKYMGARTSSVILDFETILSNSYISENLQIERDTPIYYLKRLRFKNGRIVGINETYIKKIKGLNIKDSDLDENTSIYLNYSFLYPNLTKSTYLNYN